MYSIKMLKAVLLALFITIITGCIVFARLEHLDYFTSLWMTIETVFTVGYGDYYPHTQAGRMFALFIIPLGFGLITCFIGTTVSLLIEGNINVNFRRKRMHKMIASMKDHIIVCGYGRVGQQVVKLLMNDDNKIVIIENNAAMLESVPAGIPYMVSDATEDIVLLDAGLKKAKGIIICLPEDAYTLLTTLTARGINPVIQIVARAERLESEEKLLRAGANIVINPSSIGGKRMAMSILKPTSVEYVDTLLHSKNEEYSVEEIRIINGSSLIGKTIAEADILGNYDTLIMGIARNGSIIANPPAHEMLKEMDCLIAFGSGPRLSLLEKEAKG